MSYCYPTRPQREPPLILEHLRLLANLETLLFPLCSVQTCVTTPLAVPATVWRNALERGIRLYDLRSTYAARLSARGVADRGVAERGLRTNVSYKCLVGVTAEIERI